jgi:hypothetical protein
MIVLANSLRSDINFADIKNKHQISAFLDTTMRSSDIDPDKILISTRNDYFGESSIFSGGYTNIKIGTICICQL